VNVFPTIAYADLETAIHNAVTAMWPCCEVKACRFHLGQYGKKDSEVSQFLQKIFGLSLLPQAEVCDCFVLEFYPIF
jgi:hypothetical protein